MLLQPLSEQKQIPTFKLLMKMKKLVESATDDPYCHFKIRLAAPGHYKFDVHGYIYDYKIFVNDTLEEENAKRGQDLCFIVHLHRLTRRNHRRQTIDILLQGRQTESIELECYHGTSTYYFKGKSKNIIEFILGDPQSQPDS